MFGKSSSLSRQLLTPHGQGGYSAPVRAYGKIPISSEYVDVGCDALAPASQFRSWIQSGADSLQGGSGGTLVLRDHNLLLNAGPALIISCIWHSGDRRSEQGIQRPYPFSLFVVIPAPQKPWKMAELLGLAAPLWRQMAALHPRLLASGDRAECLALIRAESIPVPQRTQPVIEDLLICAADVPFDTWLTGVDAETCVAGGFMPRLQRTHADHWQSRGRRPEVWTFPLSPLAEPNVQAAVWLSWLDANLKNPPSQVCSFVPMRTLSHHPSLRAMCRPCLTQDFLLLADDEQRIDRAAEPAEAEAAQVPHGSVPPQWDLSRLRSLRDLAGFAAPIPRRRWLFR